MSYIMKKVLIFDKEKLAFVQLTIILYITSFDYIWLKGTDMTQLHTTYISICHFNEIKADKIVIVKHHL